MSRPIKFIEWLNHEKRAWVLCLDPRKTRMGEFSPHEVFREKASYDPSQGLLFEILGNKCPQLIANFRRCLC